MKIMDLLKSFGLIIILSQFCNIQVYAQDWHEQNDYKLSYNLSGQKILIIADDESTYEETVEMADAWKGYGAEVKIASPEKKFNATKMAFSETSPSGVTHGGRLEITSDLLITEVVIDNFTAVYLPGGESYENLTTKHREKIAELLNKANKQKKVIGAFCHGPAILSVTDFIKGKNVTVEGRTATKLLVDAGAFIKDVPIITDKNVITCRFPFIESFIYTFAEKLQYPKGRGPLEKINSARIPFLTELENLAGTSNYKATPVNRDTIAAIIRIGLKSMISEKYSFNSKIRFICVDNKNLIEKIKKLALEKNKSAYGDMSEGRVNYIINRILNGTVMIFTFNDLRTVDTIKNETDKKFVESKLTFYNGASCQNLMLAANHLGLGTTLIGTSFFKTSEKELKELLNLPQNLSLVNLITLGYPESKFVPTVTRPVSEFLFFNQYQSLAN